MRIVYSRVTKSTLSYSLEVFKIATDKVGVYHFRDLVLASYFSIHVSGVGMLNFVGVKLLCEAY